MGIVVIQSLGLLLAGLLAGEEFVIRYGVQPALTSLDDNAHIKARQALVRRLRVLVPAIMAPTVLLGIAVLVFSGTGPGIAFRWTATIALVAFVLLSFGHPPLGADRRVPLVGRDTRVRLLSGRGRPAAPLNHNLQRTEYTVEPPRPGHLRRPRPAGALVLLA